VLAPVRNPSPRGDGRCALCPSWTTAVAAGPDLLYFFEILQPGSNKLLLGAKRESVCSLALELKFPCDWGFLGLQEINK